MKFNWRSFVFSLGVLLFALIAVNLMTSGVKLEGFEEGIMNPEDNCKNALKSGKDFEKYKEAVKKKALDKSLFDDKYNIKYSEFADMFKDSKNVQACSGIVNQIKEVQDAIKNKPKQVSAPPPPAKAAPKKK